MARKLASIVEISKVSPIEGADKLEVAEMVGKGWKTAEKKMDFGSALRCLKKGLKVARLGWHAKDKYLWYIPESQWSMLEDDSVELLKVADSNGGVIKCPGYVSMFLTQNDQPLVLRGWMPTPCDMLAEDWIVV